MLTGSAWIALSFWSILSGETVIGFSLWSDRWAIDSLTPLMPASLD
jgi:hypothetical protein